MAEPSHGILGSTPCLPSLGHDYGQPCDSTFTLQPRGRILEKADCCRPSSRVNSHPSKGSNAGIESFYLPSLEIVVFPELQTKQSMRCHASGPQTAAGHDTLESWRGQRSEQPVTMARLQYYYGHTPPQNLRGERSCPFPFTCMESLARSGDFHFPTYTMALITHVHLHVSLRHYSKQATLPTIVRAFDYLPSNPDATRRAIARRTTGGKLHRNTASSSNCNEAGRSGGTVP